MRGDAEQFYLAGLQMEAVLRHAGQAADVDSNLVPPEIHTWRLSQL